MAKGNVIVEQAHRTAHVERATRETQITVDLDLDGAGAAAIDTGLPFLDHMLEQVARHGLFDLTIRCRGDVAVDAHHTVEDCGLTLGRAFHQALGDRTGIRRMGQALVPMDEALAQVAIDISGRPYCVADVGSAGSDDGRISASLIRHLLESFATEARLTLHVRVLAGASGHHQAEAIFKALARALQDAVQRDPRRAGAVPSTKGTLTG
jgi:imidazoleglycerol-phosphate dehydratase